MSKGTKLIKIYWKFFLPAFLAGATLVSAFYGFRSHKTQIDEFLIYHKLLPLPETLTELYFEDHLKLPNRIDPKKEYNFSFTVHNLEYKDMEYIYKVKAKSENSQYLITNGNINLKHDEYKNVAVVFKLKNIKERTKVEVDLAGKNQRVRFWMEGK